MLDLKLIQHQPATLSKALADRHSGLDVDAFLALDARRKELIAAVETLKSRRNAASAQVGAMKRQGQDTSELQRELGGLSDEIARLDAETDKAKDAVHSWLLTVPNIPDASVPIGRDENDNVEISRWGAPREFDFTPKEHGDIGEHLQGLDFRRAAKLAGSRFVCCFGWAARLDRALAAFFLDRHAEAGYIEVSPPYLVNRATMTGTGQLPKFEEDLFRLRDWDYYLIPTAEVPLTNLHAGEAIEEERLPLGYCAATPCFRSEAGAAGKDTRGLIRMHQFTKVEMVRFAHPDASYQELDRMRDHACGLLELLELPYRVITLCTGDMGFSAAKTYDIEVWLPSQRVYREISSCSNCTDFQARRADIRYRPKGGKTAFVHTLNGSGLPTGRTMAALLENFQQQDGSVAIPPVLVPYMGGMERIEPA